MEKEGIPFSNVKKYTSKTKNLLYKILKKAFGFPKNKPKF